MKKKFTLAKRHRIMIFFFALCFAGIHLSVSAQVTLTPSDDAQVYQGSPTTNYGSKINLQIKETDGSSVTRHAYLKFAVDGLTVAQVGKATLRLYCNSKVSDSYQSVLGLFASPNGWNETAITWRNAPPKDSILSSTIVDAKNNYYEWDVTDYFKQKIANGDSASFQVTDINSSNMLIDFATKEATGNKPQLLITTTIPVVASPVLAYYVDGNIGDDANDGTSAATAWKTLNKISKSQLTEGADVLLKSGQTFEGLLRISHKGTVDNPIVVGVYGGTDPAIINGSGQAQAVFAYNAPYVEFKNLIVKNYRLGTVGAKDYFSGLLIKNENAGTLNHIHFNNVIVDSVNSTSDVTVNNTVLHGGLEFNVEGSNIPSNWNDVLVQNCTFSHLSRTGFNFTSDWDARNSNTHFGDPLGDGTFDDWFPSTQILIQDNIFSNIAGNGLIVRVAKNAMVQGNLFDSCGKTISGNATFCFSTDSTFYQFNEAKNTIYEAGETDARGIDADFRTKATIIQYNYTHDNGYGGIVATGGNQDPGTIPERFNTGTVIRYNLLENNDLQGLYFSGNIDGLEAYNNTIYADATHQNLEVIRTNKWSVAPQNLHFKNNIFDVQGTGARFVFVSTSTQDLDHNLYFGPAVPPAVDANAVVGDPLFVSTGQESGYKYLAGSPALNAGIAIPNNGGRDYYGNAVDGLVAALPNIGMYNGAPVAPLPVSLFRFTATKLGDKVNLNWATSFESNSLSFELERSTNGNQFEKIATVKAKGFANTTSDYVYEDLFPFATGINYYRLKQLDKDGKFTYSPVRIVNFGKANDKLIVYPNPAAEQITVVTTMAKEAPVLITIIDIAGKKIKTAQLGSSANIELNIADLKKGIYLLQLNAVNDNSVIGKARFLKM